MICCGLLVKMWIYQLLWYYVALIDDISNGYTLITIPEIDPWVFFPFKDITILCPVVTTGYILIYWCSVCSAIHVGVLPSARPRMEGSHSARAGSALRSLTSRSADQRIHHQSPVSSKYGIMTKELVICEIRINEAAQ